MSIGLQQPSLPPLPALPGTPRYAPPAPLRRRRSRAAQLPPMTPEEESSLLGKAVGGLAYVAGVIDKPFKATRGSLNYLLGGEAAGGPLNLIPFSDALGITDPDKTVWGRDVLTTAGISPPNKPGLEDWGWDLAGFAADLMIAPPMPIGPAGALTAKGLALSKGGRIAARAAKGAKGQAAIKAFAEGTKDAKVALKAFKPGATAKDVQAAIDIGGYIPGLSPAAYANEIRLGLRGAGGVGLPFPFSMANRKPLATFGAGSEFAAKATEALFYKSGVVPGLRSLFSHITRGVSSPQMQKSMDMAYASLQNVKGIMTDLAPAADDAYRYLGGLYKDLAKHADIAGDKAGKLSFSDAAAFIGESQSKVRAGGHLTQEEIRALFRTKGASLETLAKADEFAQGFSSLLDDSVSQLKTARYDLYKRLGGRGEDLMDRYLTHMPRRRPTDPRAARVFDETEQRLLQTDFWGALPRIFKHIPEGRVTMNRLAADVNLGRPLEMAPSKWAKFFKGSQRSGHLAVGQVVNAADRSNFGRVLGFSGDDALVHFVNPQTGKEARVVLKQSLLKPSGGAPANVPIPEALATRGQQMTGIREWFEGAGVDVSHFKPGTEDAALKAEYVFQRWLRPAAERAGADADELLRLQHGGSKYKAVEEGGKRVLKLVPDDEVKAVSGELAEYFGKQATHPEGFYTRTVMEDFLDYMTNLETSISNLHTIHSFVGGVTRTSAQLTGGRPGQAGLAGHSRLGDVWRGVQTTTKKRALHDRGLEPLAESIATKMGVQLPKDGAARAEAIASLVDDLYVPDATAKALQGQINLMHPRSAETSALGQAIQSYTALFKAGATTPYPAFHLRNRIDGFVSDMLAESSHSIADTLQYTKLAHRWLKDKGTALPHLDDAMRQNLFNTSRDLDVLGTAAEGAAALPEGGLANVLSPILHPGKHSLSPLKARGVTKDFLPGDPQFFIFEAGDRAFKLTEFLNRYVPFAAEMANGKTAAQAKRYVDLVQFNYANAIGTPFEKNFMRYVFPFYGWLKSNTMYQVANIANYPGGKNATAIRMALSLQRGSGYTPKFLQERMAMRIPGQDPDKEETAFISQFGMRFEDLQNLNLGKPRRMAERYIAQSNPLISGAYSYLTEKDPFSGREVTHLRTPIGDVAESAGLPGLSDPSFEYYGRKFVPGSRAFTEGTKAFDLFESLLSPETARKPALPALGDLLSGLKVGAYDLEKWRKRDLVRAQKEILDRNPLVWELTVPYVPEHLKETAGAETERDLALYRALGLAMRDTKKK